MIISCFNVGNNICFNVNNMDEKNPKSFPGRDKLKCEQI